MTSDLDLLRQFARENSQDAFTEIVRRHVNLVYSAALRQVRSPQLAEEIAQSVFADLARGANKLKSETVLTAWLYSVTRRTAIDVIRKESRRQLREQIAVEMNNMNATANDWTQIEPLLDDAMAALDETDRSAILLRYFENKSLREVGESLKISDDAAQKRVSRAVERLREFFSKQKITIGASGLAVLISANAVQSAPVGLALIITNASLAAAGTTLTFMKIATATKLKLAFGAIVVAAAVTAFVVQQQNQTKLHGDNESLQQQIGQLQADNVGLSNRIAAIGEANQLPAEQFDELLKLRGEVGVLRRQLDESIQKNLMLQSASVPMRGSNTNPPAPQIHIKARFLTMPKDVLSGLGGATSFNGILTSENASIALHQLESRNGVETLGEPEMVMTGGRQAQMRATQVINVITNFTLQESNNMSSIVPQTATIETGPILDVMPRVLSDGYTIELPFIASLTVFLGYATSTNTITTPAYTAAGQEVDVPTVSPQFRVQQTTNSVNLPDNQTLVFALKDVQVPTDAALMEADGSKSKLLDRQTLVFVTATIVDPAGNRVHSDDGNYTNIPPQVSSQ
ncbi:MAG TPA: sigma-70 family RNA polymerase sigma factor [Verrucomicrobiae bacterium]|jgi:RNA polymerase sigma factor (sigma-70 family)|nr:sigma-70 family RNA polymerase sigma factor [Verrucomicrobiae bacterium]